MSENLTPRHEFVADDLLNIHQDPEWCTVAVCAQVAWLFDKQILATKELAHDLNVKSGERVEIEDEWEWFLKRGYSLANYCSFDDNRLANEGISYALEYYSDRDPKIIKDFYVPEKLSQIAENLARVQRRFDPYVRRGQFVDITEPLTKEAAAQHLKEGGLIRTTTANGDHNVLVWGYDGESGNFGIFTPQETDSNDDGIGYVPGEFVDEIIDFDPAYLLRVPDTR